LIAAIGVEFHQERIHAEHGRHDECAAVPILNVSGMNDGMNQQALRIDENMPLLALDLLSRIVARRINRSPPYMGRLKSSANSCQRRFNCCPSSRPFDFPLTARAGAVDWVHSLVRPAPRAFFRPDR
jgi:hypothetical protein